jgi:hypothetical protein
MGRVWAVSRLCELQPGICLTIDEKERKTPSQGSRRVPVGAMKTIYRTYITIRIHKHNNKIFTFAPCMLLHLLYSKPTHSLLLNTHFFKTIKLLKNVL